MKNIYLHRIWMLISVLILTISHTFATDVTISVANDTWTSTGTSGTGGTTSVTKSGITVSSTKGYKDGTTAIREYSGCEITVSSSVGNITKIAFTSTASGTSNNGPSKIGLKSGQSGSYSYSEKVGTWTYATGANSVVFSASAQFRWTQVVVTYSGGTTYTVTYNANGGSGTMSNGTGASVTIADCSFTAPSGKTFSKWNTNSSGTGTDYAVGASVTQDLNLYAIWIDLPKYTVTLKDDNSTLTETSAGAGVDLPTRTGCTGYTFAGWTKSWATAQTTWTTTAPTIIPAGSYTPTADENLYPVYTKTEGGGTAWSLCSTAASVTAGTYVITWDNSYYLPSETTASSNPAVGSGITVSNDNLSNTVTSAMQWTFTGNNTDGYSISHVSGNNTYKLSATNAAQGISVTTGSTSITWTVSVDNTYGMLLHGSDGGSRYLAVYNSGSWRYYATGNSYLGTLRLYKQTTASTTSYISVPNCCTPLGQINGPINLTRKKASIFNKNNTEYYAFTNE